MKNENRLRLNENARRCGREMKQGKNRRKQHPDKHGLNTVATSRSWRGFLAIPPGVLPAAEQSMPAPPRQVKLFDYSPAAAVSLYPPHTRRSGACFHTASGSFHLSHGRSPFSCGPRAADMPLLICHPFHGLAPCLSSIAHCVGVRLSSAKHRPVCAGLRVV